MAASVFDDIFHAVAFTYDDNYLSKAQEKIKQRRNQVCVIVEDLRPFFKGAIGGDNN